MIDTDDDTDEFDERLEVLGEFLEDLTEAADPDGVVRRYAAAHPAWATDFYEEAAMGRLLTAARVETGVPDLSRLTDFRVIRLIAAGGMGVVYEAEQLTLGRRVALKVRYGPPSPEREAGFEREQLVLAKLHQSHIVPIYQAGRCGPWQFIAMAYIDGATLNQLLAAARDRRAAGLPVTDVRQLTPEAQRRSRAAAPATRLADYAADLSYLSARFDAPPVPAARADPAGLFRPPASYFRSVARLVADAAEAVAHAHAAGVVHRDVKPSNIMVDVHSQCWLIDFGLAVSGAAADAAGRHAGTPGYIAPENIPNNGLSPAAPADALSDVWSLGVTLFEAVTLSRPAEAVGPGGELPLVRALAPAAPADLAAICHKAVQRDPRKRYPSARELADDLRHWLAGRPTAARPPAPGRAAVLWAKRNPGWAAALVCAVLLAAGGGAFTVARAGHREEQAELRRQAAEAQATDGQEKVKLLDRDALLQNVQHLQLGDVNDGWSAEAWEMLRQANAVRSDDHVRDLAVGSLRGWDATVEKYFPLGSSAVAFDPAGRSLAIGGLDAAAGQPARTAATWAGGAAEPIESALAGAGPVAWDTHGNPMQLVREKGELILWNMAKKTATWRAPAPGRAPGEDSTPLALSSAAEWVSAAEELDAGARRTRVWKTAAASPWLEFDFAADAVAFSGKQEYVALADSRRRRIVIHSLSTKELVAELPTGAVPILSLAFGKNPRQTSSPLAKHVLAAGDGGGTVAVWDLQRRLPVSYFRGLPHQVLSLAFHPDGTHLATGGRYEVRIWDVASGKHCLRVRPREGLDFVTQIAFSHDGSRLAFSSRGVFSRPCTTVWALDNRRGLTRLSGLSGQIETVVVSPDGKTAAALAQNWELGVWDLASGRLKYTADVPAGLYADNAGLAFSADGRTLAYAVSTAGEGTALLLDAASGAERKRWRLPPGLQNHFGFAGPNTLWHFQVEIEDASALPGSDKPWQANARVGRVRNLLAGDGHAVVAEIRDFPRHVYQARMSPDCKLMAIEGLDKGSRWIKVVETATGNVLAAYPSANTQKAAGLWIDSAGRWAWFTDTEGPASARLTLPAGPLGRLPGVPAFASNAVAGFCYRPAHGDVMGGFLSLADDGRPLVNFALGALPGAAVFDPLGRRLLLGAPDGDVTVCDLEAVRVRLNSLGLGWPDHLEKAP